MRDDSRGTIQLVLASPISFKGRVVQYAGRLHRESEGKTDVRIHDDLDASSPVMLKMFRKRRKQYEATISVDPMRPRSMRLACSACSTTCEHLGAALSLILEEKLSLGLSVPPPGSFSARHSDSWVNSCHEEKRRSRCVGLPRGCALASPSSWKQVKTAD